MDPEPAVRHTLVPFGSVLRMNLGIVGAVLVLAIAVPAFLANTPPLAKYGTLALGCVMILVAVFLRRPDRHLGVGADGVYYEEGRDSAFWPYAQIRSMGVFSAQRHVQSGGGSWSGVALELTSGQTIDLLIGQATVDATRGPPGKGTWVPPDESLVSGIASDIRQRLANSRQRAELPYVELAESSKDAKAWLDRVRALGKGDTAAYRGSVPDEATLSDIARDRRNAPRTRVGALIALRAAGHEDAGARLQKLATEMANPAVRLAIATIGSGWNDDKVMSAVEVLSELEQ